MNQLDEAIKFALRHVKIKREDIFDPEKTRKKATVHAKKLIIRYLYDKCNWTLPQIAKHLKYADHTTVMYLYQNSGHEWYLATYRYDDNV